MHCSTLRALAVLHACNYSITTISQSSCAYRHELPIMFSGCALVNSLGGQAGVTLQDLLHVLHACSCHEWPRVKINPQASYCMAMVCRSTTIHFSEWLKSFFFALIWWRLRPGRRALGWCYTQNWENQHFKYANPESELIIQNTRQSSFFTVCFYSAVAVGDTLKLYFAKLHA